MSAIVRARVMTTLSERLRTFIAPARGFPELRHAMHATPHDDPVATVWRAHATELIVRAEPAKAASPVGSVKCGSKVRYFSPDFPQMFPQSVAEFPSYFRRFSPYFRQISIIVGIHVIRQTRCAVSASSSTAGSFTASPQGSFKLLQIRSRSWRAGCELAI